MIVMLSVRSPHRNGRAIGTGVEVDEDLLPIGLVVVRPIEAGAPVIEGKEEPILESRPGGRAHDATVVRMRGALLGRQGAVSKHGRPCERAGHSPACEQRDGEHGVDEARAIADSCQPSASRMKADGLPALALEHRRDIVGGGRPRDRKEVPSIRPVSRLVRERCIRERSTRAQDLVLTLAVAAQVRRLLEVGRHAHWQERLAKRVPNDRLEGAEELEVGCVDRRPGCWARQGGLGGPIGCHLRVPST